MPSHLRSSLISATLAVVVHATAAETQDVLRYRTGTWDRDTVGNHRAVVWVEQMAGAVRVRIPWRRPDRAPEEVQTLVVDAASGERITNVVPIEVNREFGEFVFQPKWAPAEYHFYYLPHTSSGSRYYPTVEYLAPRSTADSSWIARYRLTASELATGQWQRLPRATAHEIQAVSEFDSFYPMEVIATAAETEALLASQGDVSLLLFGEDRIHPIRMRHDLPYRWVERGAFQTFEGSADRGEFYAFQVGVYAVREVRDASVAVTDFRSEHGGVIAAETVRAFNFGGVDSQGRGFTTSVTIPAGSVQPLWFGVAVPEDAAPGAYRSTVTLSAPGHTPRSLPVVITVTRRSIAAHGDDEPWRLSRLRWLDSRIALDDEIVRPFSPVEVRDRRLRVLGREVRLTDGGLPEEILSAFAPEVTHLVERDRKILAAPVRLIVDDAARGVLRWRTAPLRFATRNPGRAAWDVRGEAGDLVMRVHGELEFDGTLDYSIALQATRTVDLDDVRLEIPIARDVAQYMMGMGVRGGYRPEHYEWRWNVEHNQDGAWIGDVNAGIQFSLRDEHYERPLNTNFYLSKPLVMPRSWANAGRGGCRFAEEGRAFLVRCFTGTHTIAEGDSLRFDFRLTITPFKPIDTDAQWRTRFFHRYAPLDSIQALGANTVNVHHATPINPYINYPFLTPDTMRAYVEAAHRRDMRVKIYYTVRELTHRAPELFALSSLGHEVLASGPGGGPSWLQEHFTGDYIAGWFVPSLRDAAVVNSGVSRWHNFYLEGLDWLARNIGIDGLYIDDVAFDRVTMKRVRKILDRNRPNALIDLHSANQFNERDGYASSANLYLEHFPFINRLWFGEYFDYDASPDRWLIEMSGIPFGLMGEMLQDGGNPWRGLVFGMTNRLPWAGDPSPIWNAWDRFGMEGSRMIGYWVPHAPVRTGRDDVLATVYVRGGKALVALASWADELTEVDLQVDWRALGLDRDGAAITAPEIRDFQIQRTFVPEQPLPVAPGRGWLLVIQ
jgi:hypothetical protein